MINIEKLKSIKYYSKLTEEEYTFLQKQFKWIESKKEGIYCLRNNITSKPVCENPDCNNTKHFNPSGNKGYTKGCSKSCTVKITMLEKYGVTNPGQLASVKEKVKNTVRKKYGVDNVFQSEEIKEKSKETMMKKYGVEYSSQREEYIDLVKQTSLEQYGVEHPNKSKKKIFKTKKTILTRYGVENIGTITRDKALKTMIKKYGCHSSQSPKIKEKIKQNCLKKYGVEYPSQNPEVYKAMFKKCVKYKIFKWKDGTEVNVQGNEPIILSELEKKGYTSKEVLTDVTDMPPLWYEYKNKKRRYYPDIYIPKENLIIEVKSQYTLEKQFEKNMMKFKAVKDAGFNFKLEVR